MIKNIRTFAEPLHSKQVVRHKNNSSTSSFHLMHFGSAFTLKVFITNSENLVNQQNIWSECSCTSESKASLHSATIIFHRFVGKLLNFGKLQNAINRSLSRLSRNTHESKIKKDVFPARKLTVETSTEFNQRSQSSIVVNLT